MRLVLLLWAISDAAKLLVLYENPQVRVSHSKVLDALEENGFDLTLKVVFTPLGTVFSFHFSLLMIRAWN